MTAKAPPGKLPKAAPKALLPLRATDTEVEAYGFIRDQLREVGWSVKNPSRPGGGQVWTQNQCLAHPEIKRCLGAKRPENVVKLTETKLWVIEAKRTRPELTQAIKEAEEDYAWPIQNGGVLSVPLISGVAGNDDTSYEIRTRLLVNGKYLPVIINGHEATGLLDPTAVAQLLQTGNPVIADFAVNESVFLKAAEHINKVLHLGGINKNDRARVMSALLLALLSEPGPNVDADLTVLIEHINTLTKSVLRKHGKVEFHPFVTIQPPTNEENHVKFRWALVQTVQELHNLSIKSAMNSGADVLGKFYEVFLKYGNGAKEIGIVLTPRHVTRFAVEALGVGPTDIVLDPACGTGGFLVAAFDHVRKLASEKQIERFKKHNLFGIERESYVAALAIVNMIFRGDGKNNIVEANCFTKFLTRATVENHASAKYIREPATKGEEPITRIFMNPPFALKESDEKEYRFVETALKNMADGGLLFAIVPMSVMCEGGNEAKWRKDSLLPHHTLLSVVSFPEELFYPVANQTVGIVVKKGTPHPKDQPVFWGRVVNDGFQKSKGKRLPMPDTTPNDLKTLMPALRGFLLDPAQPVNAVPEFVKTTPIDFTDPLLELVPEAYLDNVPSVAVLAQRLDRQVRENAAAIVEIDFTRPFNAGAPESIVDLARGAPAPVPTPIRKAPKYAMFSLGSLFHLHPGDYHSLSPTEIDPGDVPIASCGDLGNGIVGAYVVPPKNIHGDALTIAFNGRPLTTKLHPYRFAAKDDVAVAYAKTDLPVEALIFIQATLNSERWRFSYYRKCFRAKLIRFTLALPATGAGKLDVDFMLKAVRASPYWWFIAPRLQAWKPAPATSTEPAP